MTSDTTAPTPGAEPPVKGYRCIFARTSGFMAGVEDALIGHTEARASLPVVAWMCQHKHGHWNVVTEKNLREFQPKEVQESWGTSPTLQALVLLSDAQATIYALRAERDAAIAETAEIRARWNDAENELSALATLQAENARLALDLATMTEAALDRRASAQKACEAAEHIHAENARLQDEVNRLSMVEPTSRAGALLAQMHTDLADAQSQVARLVRERDDLRIEVVEADRLIATLKASMPDIEAVMRLADAWVVAAIHKEIDVLTGKATNADPDAAREALRRSLTVGVGSGSEGRS